MAKMQALILAAGRGSRMGQSGKKAPKSLLQVGRRPLIEHQLDTLAQLGVDRVHVVVGYGSDEVREVVGARAGFVSNLRWDSTNSLYSFWLARSVIEGDVIVLNCDVLFPPEVIERLVDTPGDAIAIDSTSGGGWEEMKVRVADGRVTGMSKELPAGEVSGENLGVLKLTGETARVLFEEAGEILSQGREMAWLAAAIDAMAAEREFHAVDVAGVPWVEIDFSADLDRARKKVWPAIAGGAYKRRQLRRKLG